MNYNGTPTPTEIYYSIKVDKTPTPKKKNKLPTCRLHKISRSTCECESDLKKLKKFLVGILKKSYI